MTDMLQGEQLPSTITTTEKQTITPEFYTNYLQDIANLGQNAVSMGGVAGFSPLQMQAFQMAPETAFSGSGTLGSAAQLAGMSGTTGAYDIINNYMNPYTKTVVDEMARQQQQNIQRNVLPALKAAGTATGGFGSSRQAGVTGQTMADMQANLLGQQYGALSSGYSDAMKAAQADLTRQLQAGQTLGQIGTEQSNVGLAGLKTLTDLGGLEQAQGQKILDKPMLDAQNFAKLMQGYTIPAGTVEQVTAPGKQDQFQNSPLATISGLASLINSIWPQSGTTEEQKKLLTAQTDYYNKMAGNVGVNAPATINPAQISAAAQQYGLTLEGGNRFSKKVGNTTTYYDYDPATGGFVKVVAQGGLIQAAGGGSISDLAFNDAANGNTYTFSQ